MKQAFNGFGLAEGWGLKCAKFQHRMNVHKNSECSELALRPNFANPFLYAGRFSSCLSFICFVVTIIQLKISKFVVVIKYKF